MNLTNQLTASIIATIFTCSIIASYCFLDQTQKQQALIQQNQVVMQELKSILANLRASESAERGYINTSDRQFLHPYYTASIELPKLVNSLCAHSADNPLRQTMLQRLNQLIEQKLHWEAQLIATADKVGRESAVELQLTHVGLNITADINQLVKEIEFLESSDVSQHRRAYTFASVCLFQAVLLAATLGLLFLIKAIEYQHKSLALERQRESVLHQVERLNSDLQMQVADLKRTRENLQKALSIKQEFLANMNHELRTPLSGVIGASELLLSMPLKPDERELIQTVRQCGHSLLNMIEEILDYASLNAHDLHLERTEFVLLSAVNNAIEPLRPAAEAKNLELKLVVSPDLPETVIGDSARITQILTNLIDNAIKFTDHGTVTVSVSLLFEKAFHNAICFTVSDTGIGIKSEHLEAIFERFFQVDGSSTRLHGGAGLGLSIARSLVEMMRGTIEVHSRFGSGSEFSVSLPLTKPKTINTTGSNLSGLGEPEIESAEGAKRRD